MTRYKPVEDPTKHRDFVSNELTAYHMYSPLQMQQCDMCDNWHPEKYCCPVCGYDHTAPDD